MPQHAPHLDGSGNRIRLTAIGVEPLERASQPRHGTHAAIRQAGAQRALRVHQQSHAILDRYGMFGEPRGHIRIQSQAIEISGTHAAGTARIDDDENLQVLCFAVLA